MEILSRVRACVDGAAPRVQVGDGVGDGVHACVNRAAPRVQVGDGVRDCVGGSAPRVQVSDSMYVFVLMKQHHVDR